MVLSPLLHQGVLPLSKTAVVLAIVAIHTATIVVLPLAVVVVPSVAFLLADAVPADMFVKTLGKKKMVSMADANKNCPCHIVFIPCCTTKQFGAYLVHSIIPDVMLLLNDDLQGRKYCQCSSESCMMWHILLMHHLVVVR